MNKISNRVVDAAPAVAGPTMPDPKKPSGWLIPVALALTMLITFAVVGLSTLPSHSSNSTGSTAPVVPLGPIAHTVTYKVTGTADTVDITMSGADGDTSQQSNLGVPIKNKAGGDGLTLRNMHEGDFLYISAQNQGSSGSVTCTILVDGVRVKTSTSSGAYVIATCSGQL